VRPKLKAQPIRSFSRKDCPMFFRFDANFETFYAKRSNLFLTVAVNPKN